MSEAFDPEKVERWNICIGGYPVVVSAADYDKLLELYRDMKVALGMGPDEPFIP